MSTQPDDVLAEAGRPEKRRGRAGLVIQELNYKRKAHRVNIPLVIDIDGELYRAFDWSVDGVGIKDERLSPTPGTSLAARCVLPMPDAQVTIDVQLDYRGTHNDIHGFSFSEISPNVRRLLRHYIELAVDGQLANVEDLVSVVTTPGVMSPVHDALNLTDLEREGMLRQFKQKSALAITAGALFIALLVGVLFYNTTYRIAATGLVSGNLEAVTANTNGVVDNIFVSAGNRVEAGTPLFQVRNADDQQRLKELDRMITGVNEQLAAVRQRAEETRLGVLLPAERLLEQRKVEYERGKDLYEDKILPFRDFVLVEHQYHEAKFEVLREKAKMETELKLRSTELEQRLGALQTEREGVLKRMQAASVQAKVTGRVVNVQNQAGNYVTRNDPVVLIEQDARPFVLVKLLAQDAIKLRMGMPAEIHAPEAGVTYAARVASVGYAAADSRATRTMEASLNETLVRLEFDQAGVRLPANSRVNVWIKTL